MSHAGSPEEDEAEALLEAPSWSRVAQVSLIRREIRESLSPNAIELLFSHAELVIEAGQDPGGSSAYATVMVTIDLSRCKDLVREPSDAATAHRVAELMEKDKRVAARLKQLARPYLCEQAARSVALKQIGVEFRARAQDERVLIDGDAMVTLSPNPGGGA